VDETVTTRRALETIDAEREAWRGLVAEVGEDRMDEPGPMGDWTFTDLAAHIAGWRRYWLARLEAELRGEADPPPPWPPELTTDDEINAWLHDRGRGRPRGEVLAEADATFHRLRAIVEALPADELTDPARFPSLEGRALGGEIVVSGGFFAHLHEEHEPDVRAWLGGETAGGEGR
jgi:hypothetical protein